MARHVMDILDRATTAVPPQDKYEVFLYYIKKVEEYYGATKTREVYEKALEVVPDERVKDIALRFADLETKLGEIDRARAIYTYASQFCNPQTQITFWKMWLDFEGRHGNKETFKEMKRIERSVQAEFAQVRREMVNVINMINMIVMNVKRIIILYTFFTYTHINSVHSIFSF